MMKINRIRKYIALKLFALAGRVMPNLTTRIGVADPEPSFTTTETPHSATTIRIKKGYES
jgi:hypothetical protein